MKSKGTSVDASYLKQVNQRLILNAVYESKTTSRAALSHALGMSKPAISDNLSELLASGIVREAGEGTVARKGGRRPLLLKLNENYRYIVAVDLNYANPVIALGNLKNEIIREIDIRLAADESPGHYMTVIESAINRLLGSCGCTPEDLFCIAVSSPGVFDAGGNVLSQNTGYGRVLWSECNLLQTLQTLYAVPVIVKNDIKAATLGEWAYGAGRGEEDLLYVSCGVGLGAGIVLRSKLYEGRRFSAGEVYYTLDTDRLPDAETLEDRICMKQLIESSAADVRNGAQTCLRDCAHPIGFEDIVAAYRRKDPFVCEKVRRICDALCALMFNLGNFLALDRIIFGGEYAAFSDTLLAAYEKQCKPLLKPGADVCLAALGRYSGIYGMLFTAREACFDAICRQSKAGEPKP